MFRVPCSMFFLAYLWGAYACTLGVVHRTSSVSTITTRNNKDIKSIFGADVHHVPGLCLLGNGGAPYIILPRAEVPRDLDIVPLPPGPFYIKIELFFYSAIFECILNKIRLHLYQRLLSNTETHSFASLLDVKC